MKCYVLWEMKAVNRHSDLVGWALLPFVLGAVSAYLVHTPMEHVASDTRKVALPHPQVHPQVHPQAELTGRVPEVRTSPPKESESFECDELEQRKRSV